MRTLPLMKATAKELAKDSKRILNAVIAHGETVQIQRQGRTVAEVRPKVGVSRKEFLRRMRGVRFTDKMQAELKNAMEEGAKVFGYAGRH
jgi:hypothetical protein